MDATQATQLGAIGIIFIFFIREFFTYLKNRKNGNGWNQKSYDELQVISNNHLTHIEDTIREGNERIVKAITDGNQRMVELLGEIKGRLK